jgi:hypothetical protein
MANTYVALAKTVLTTTQATITFSSIPATYTDLVLQISARSSQAADNQDPLWVRFNSDTANNYSFTNVYGYQSSTVYSDRAGNIGYFQAYSAQTANNPADVFGSIEIYIPNYTSTTTRPVSITGVTENTSAGGVYVTMATAANWRGTAAISTITLILQTGPNFLSGSRFDLYGIKSS